MIDNLVTAAGLACFLFGLFVFFSAVLGLFRFDYVLNPVSYTHLTLPTILLV